MAGRQAGRRAMSTLTSPGVAAIEHLEAERANLLARVEKVDQAIAHLRELFHLPESAPRAGGTRAEPLRPRRARARAGDRGDGQIAQTRDVTLPSWASMDAIRTALKDGPLSPAVLGARVKLSRYQIGVLVDRGALVASGQTAGRRVALPSGGPKEAP